MSEYETRDISPDDDSTIGGLDSILEETPDQIGPYKILAKLGEGGFGVVYEAQQEEPVKRRVALKVIKPGMDSKKVIARFEAERQALALMTHANIAKVLGGGLTDRGLPFFVMELVKGEPITEFCDRNKMTLNDRLELMIPVCHAVQHAHAKAVIHRDLKPSNILVGYDAEGHPTPTVIDFGVAKALNQQLTEKTIYTQEGQMIGTPEYMSPEQAEMSGVDIDTRTDVYSLGVVLYELLTGMLPFGAADLRSKAYAEMQRIIREQDPPRPSTKLSAALSKEGTHDDVIRSAKIRHMSEGELSKHLRGELDWVVMKCLEKDRDRRYATPIALAEEIQHYLHDEPVLARPPSVRYRMGKLIKRNWGPVAAAMVFIGMLIAATLMSARLSWIADVQRNLAVEALEERDSALASEQEQRIEAESATRESQLLLRQSFVDAANTAYSRGYWKQVVENVERALAIGVDDPGLELALLHYDAIGNYQEFGSIERLAVLKQHPQAGSARARLQLREARQSSFFSPKTKRKATRLYKEALAGDLPERERYEALAASAPDAPASLAYALRAIKIDPLSLQAREYALLASIFMGDRLGAERHGAVIESITKGNKYVNLSKFVFRGEIDEASGEAIENKDSSISSDTHEMISQAGDLLSSMTVNEYISGMAVNDRFATKMLQKIMTVMYSSGLVSAEQGLSVPQYLPDVIALFGRMTRYSITNNHAGSLQVARDFYEIAPSGYSELMVASELGFNDRYVESFDMFRNSSVVQAPGAYQNYFNFSLSGTLLGVERDEDGDAGISEEDYLWAMNKIASEKNNLMTIWICLRLSLRDHMDMYTELFYRQIEDCYLPGDLGILLEGSRVKKRDDPAYSIFILYAYCIRNTDDTASVLQLNEEMEQYIHDPEHERYLSKDVFIRLQSDLQSHPALNRDPELAP